MQEGLRAKEIYFRHWTYIILLKTVHQYDN